MQPSDVSIPFAELIQEDTETGERFTPQWAKDMSKPAPTATQADINATTEVATRGLWTAQKKNEQSATTGQSSEVSLVASEGRNDITAAQPPSRSGSTASPASSIAATVDQPVVDTGAAGTDSTVGESVASVSGLEATPGMEAVAAEVGGVMPDASANAGGVSPALPDSRGGIRVEATPPTDTGTTPVLPDAPAQVAPKKEAPAPAYTTRNRKFEVRMVDGEVKATPIVKQEDTWSSLPEGKLRDREQRRSNKAWAQAIRQAEDEYSEFTGAKIERKVPIPKAREEHSVILKKASNADDAELGPMGIALRQIAGIGLTKAEKKNLSPKEQRLKEAESKFNLDAVAKELGWIRNRNEGDQAETRYSEEAKNAKWAVDPRGKLTIEGVAHSMMENGPRDENGDPLVSEQEYREAIIDVFRNHSTKTSAIQALKDMLPETPEERLARIQEEQAQNRADGFTEEEEAAVESALDNMTDEELNEVWQLQQQAEKATYNEDDAQQDDGPAAEQAGEVPVGEEQGGEVGQAEGEAESLTPEIPNTPIGNTKTVVVGGKKRTVFNSNGKPIHPTVEGVRNFWRWFGDSKVVDAEGRPLVVYHGTNTDFDVFDPSIQKHGRELGDGVYFTADKARAENYGGRVVEAYLSIQDPFSKKLHVRDKSFLIASPELTDFVRQKRKENAKNGVPESMGPVVKKQPDGSHVVTYIDGLPSRNNSNDGVISVDENQFVAFSPTQIKSATGNYGTFDPANESISDEPTSLTAEDRKSLSDRIFKLADDLDAPMAQRQSPERTALESEVASAQKALDKALKDINSRGQSLFSDQEGTDQTSLGDAFDNSTENYDRILGPLRARVAKAKAALAKYDKDSSEGEAAQGVLFQRDDYGGSHRPSKNGPQAHDILADDIAPDDILGPNAARYYGGANVAEAQKAIAILRAIQGNPEAEVTIYRAGPKNELNDGDWITLTKGYAKEHAKHPTDPKKDDPVHSFKVKAREIRWAGDDLNEFGYFPSEAKVVAQKSTNTAPTKTGKLRTDRVAAALRKLVPDLEIIAPKTKEEYAEATKAISEGLGSTWGIYDPRTNKLYLNPSSPDLRQTFFHEAAHPIIIALAKNKPELFTKFYEQLRTERGGKYIKFGQQYSDLSEAAQMAEALAEFFGDVAAGKVPVSTKPDSLYQQFKNFIKDILAALGWDMRSIDLSKPTDVREFAAQMKKAFDKGIAIEGFAPLEGSGQAMAQRPYGPIPTDTHKAALNAVAASVRAGDGLSNAIAKGMKEVRKSDWYKALDAIQQAQVEADFKAPIKALATPVDKKPSTAPKKLQKQVMEAAGKTPSPKIVVNEKSALKDQLRMAGMNARAGAKDQKQRRKDFAQQVKEILSKDKFRGTVGATQVATIMNRALSVNLDNPKSIDRFAKYAEQVAEDVTYEGRMNDIRAAQKSAKRRNHAQFQSAVTDFLKVKPEDIPDHLVGDYMEALSDMAKAVPSYRAMQDVYYPLMQATKRGDPKEVASNYEFENEAEELWDRIAEAEIDGVESYKALQSDIAEFKRKMNMLLENESITEEAYLDVMEGLEERQKGAEANAELTSLKTDLIQDIFDRVKSIGTLNLTGPTKDLLKDVYNLDNDQLRQLTVDELITLSDILELAQQDGYVDAFRLSPIIAKAIGREAAPSVAEQLKKAKPIKEQADVLERLRTVSSTFWEGALGLGKIRQGAYYRNLVAPIQRASAAYIELVQGGRRFFAEAKKKYKLKQDNMDRIGMAALYLREYALRFDPSKAGKKDENGLEYGTRDWFGEILGGDLSRYNSKEQRRMRKAYESLPKNADGKVDPQAVHSAYRDGTDAFLSKNEMAFLRDAFAWNEQNLLERQRTANHLRGKPFKELMYHVHRKRMDRVGAKQAPDDVPFGISDKGSVRISSNVGKEATSEKITPIAFNYEQLFDTALENVSRDYNFTPTLRRTNATIKAVRAAIGKDKQAYMDVTADNIQEALNAEFSSSNRGPAGRLAMNLMKARAAQVFLDVLRTVREGISSFLSYPLRAGTLRGYKNVGADLGIVRRLIADVDSPLRNRANINKWFEMEKGTIEAKGFFERTSQSLASAPETILLKPVWYARFQDEFADITGVEFDAKKYENSETYRYDNRKAIAESALQADAAYETIAGPATASGQRRRIKVLPAMVTKAMGTTSIDSKTTMGKVAGFMTGYPHREFLQAVDSVIGVAQAMREGRGLGDRDVKRLLMAPVGAMVGAFAYNYMAQLQYAFQNLLTADDDEEKELAQAELDALLSKEGVLTELMTGAVSLGATKYSGAGRQMLKAAGSILYNFTDNKEEKAAIRSMVRNLTFQNPYMLSDRKGGERGGLYESIGEALPFFSGAVENFVKLQRSAGDMEKMRQRARNGEPLDKAEQEALIAAAFMANVFNAVGQFAGVSVPSATLNRLSKKYTPQYRNEYDEEQAQRRAESRGKTNEVTSIVERYASGKLTRKQADAEFKKQFAGLPEDERTSLVKSYKRRVQYVEAPDRVKEVLDIETAAIRAKMVKERRAKMSEAEKRKFNKELAEAGVLTDKFKEEYRKLK